MTHHIRVGHLYTQFLRFCVAQLHTDDMHQEVSVGAVDLHMCNRGETHGRSKRDTDLLGPELSLTFLPRPEGYQVYAKRKLGSGDEHKPNRD